MDTSTVVSIVALALGPVYFWLGQVYSSRGAKVEREENAKLSHELEISGKRWERLSDSLYKGLPIIRALYRPLYRFHFARFEQDKLLGREHTDALDKAVGDFQDWLRINRTSIYMHKQDLFDSVKGLEYRLRSISESIEDGVASAWKGNGTPGHVVDIQLIKFAQEHAGLAMEAVQPVLSEVERLLFAPPDEVLQVHRQLESKIRGLREELEGETAESERLLTAGTARELDSNH
tara:strand:+ start:176 stop:877 length:702 start_codon:yes stop_codon:yes gene_type:complete